MIQNFWDAAFLQNVIDCHDNGKCEDLPYYVEDWFGNFRNKLQNEIEVWQWHNAPCKVGETYVMYVRPNKRYDSPTGTLTNWMGSELAKYTRGLITKRYSDKYGTYHSIRIEGKDEFGSIWRGLWRDHQDSIVMKKCAKHRPAKVGDRIRATTNYSYSHNHSITGTVTSVFETKDGDYSYTITGHGDYVNHWNYNISNLSR